MAATAPPDPAYDLSGYPKEQTLFDGSHVVLRPMVPEDEAGLLEFFRQIPEEDRQYLKEDVESPAVIREWSARLDYGRVLPLLALVGQRIVADATLHRRRSHARGHTGEIRIVVAPAYQAKGLGTHLTLELLDLAAEAGLERVVLEVAEAGQKEAIGVAERLGFGRIATLPDHLKDGQGRPQDLVIMEMPLGQGHDRWRW